MTNKEQYTSFCQRNPLMPVTMQPWWLDAVCAGKQWDVLLIMRSELQSSSWWQRKKELPAETEDEIVAALPYLLSKRLWYKFVVMPQMTIAGGVWLSDELQAAPDMQEALAKVLAKKLRELKIAYYYQRGGRCVLEEQETPDRTRRRPQRGYRNERRGVLPFSYAMYGRARAQIVVLA